MTREDRNLLLEDICNRLPYGVKGLNSDGNLSPPSDWSTEFTLEKAILYRIEKYSWRPYLFPMSSMTKEQEKEYDKAYMKDMEAVRNNLFKFAKGESILDGAIMYHHIDWLNKNKFDYRGLIPMGLAKDATGLNIYTHV